MNEQHIFRIILRLLVVKFLWPITGIGYQIQVYTCRTNFQSSEKVIRDQNGLITGILIEICVPDFFWSFTWHKRLSLSVCLHHFLWIHSKNQQIIKLIFISSQPAMNIDFMTNNENMSKWKPNFGCSFNIQFDKSKLILRPSTIFFIGLWYYTLNPFTKWIKSCSPEHYTKWKLIQSRCFNYCFYDWNKGKFTPIASMIFAKALSCPSNTPHYYWNSGWMGFSGVLIHSLLSTAYMNKDFSSIPTSTINKCKLHCLTGIAKYNVKTSRQHLLGHPGLGTIIWPKLKLSAWGRHC